MKKIASSLIFAFVIVAAQSVAAAEPDPLRALEFLIGQWDSVGEGKPGEATGVAVFTASLQKHAIVRTAFAEYPTTDKRPASRHDDLMVIYAEAGTIRADYYDSEGHVIRYAVRSDQPNHAVFTSDVVTGAPRYRLAYELDATGKLHGSFDIAPPGKPDAFAQYLSWVSRRR